MKKKNKIIQILVFISLTTSILISNSNTQNDITGSNKINSLKKSSFEFSNGGLTVSLNLSVLEESENFGLQENLHNVNFSLGTSRWNITDIELNITDITFENETKTIEDIGEFSFLMSKDSYLNLGVQIELLVPTIIYGVYIFAQNITIDGSGVKKSFLQIQGNDKLTNKPNGTILRSTPLNISKSVGKDWHMQKFQNPLPLNKGIYYLVVNCSKLADTPVIPSIKYYWWYCSDFEGPNYPYLNVSNIYKGTTTWSTPINNNPFLYKLIQKVNNDFYPNEINMTAEINGKKYSIENGVDIATGKLNQNFNDFFPNTTSINIPFKNNISEALIFNVSYFFKLDNNLNSESSILIKENQKNFWKVEPDLDRFGNNYTVKFCYPDSWDILKVFNNTDELTPGQYSDSGGLLYVYNNTILETTNYLLITANSTSFNPTINPEGITSYTAGQELGFWVENLPNIGNYTFVLVDSIGKDIHTDFELKSDKLRFDFNYTLLLSSKNGIYTAYVFWNNETDAGVDTQLFTVGGGTSPIPTTPSNDGGGGDSTNVAEGIAPIVVTIVIIAIIAGFSGSIASYVGYKEVKRRREKQRQKLFNQFMDVYNLSYIMISHKKSGLNVYEKSFAGASINPTLISGYLNALNILGIELTGSFEQSQSIKLEYQNLLILMSDFRNLRITFILKENPSTTLVNSVRDLSYVINNKYGDKLEKFDGQRITFEGIGDILEQYLHVSLISPLKIETSDTVKLEDYESYLVSKAKHIMKINAMPYFFASYLLANQKYNDLAAKTIISLIRKGIFKPIDIEINK